MSNQTILQFLRNSFLHRPLRSLAHWYILQRWQLNGRPLPPPALYKQKLVQEYGRRYALQTLVETGTAQGKMIRACQDHFQRIISIELDPHLHRQAQAQFAASPHITLLQGDSGHVLAQVLAALSEPALFWLDAHAMVGGIRPPQVTPILQELDHLLAHPLSSHVILIDDARLFIEKSAYPSIPQVQSTIEKSNPALSVTVKDDVIRICPT
jgi:hypothetical protein